MEKIKPSFTSIIFLLLFLIIPVFNPPMPNAQAGVYHLVKKNETIWSISRAYGVPVQELAKVNNLIDINSIPEDSVLFIPSACQVIDNAEDTEIVGNKSKMKNNHSRVAGVKDSSREEELRKEKTVSITKKIKKEDVDESVAVNVSHQKSSDKEEPQSKIPLPDKKINAGNNNFVWPVRGNVKASFGVQSNKTFNNWIKIISAAGKKIKAAESGTVIFSSYLKNYGETIIIKHKDNFATVYTHLKKRLVKIDRNVTKGEAIAVLGEKDDAGEVYMNFEIRVRGKAQNPLLFLP